MVSVLQGTEAFYNVRDKPRLFFYGSLTHFDVCQLGSAVLFFLVFTFH